MQMSAARIFVRDLAAARDFYTELGLALESQALSHGVCVFNAGSTRLIVETVAADAPESEQTLVGRFTGLSFHTDSIASKYEALVAAGVDFTGAPEQQYWGGWLATFMDPAENQLQLVQSDA